MCAKTNLRSGLIGQAHDLAQFEECLLAMAIAEVVVLAAAREPQQGGHDAGIAEDLLELGGRAPDAAPRRRSGWCALARTRRRGGSSDSRWPQEATDLVVTQLLAGRRAVVRGRSDRLGEVVEGVHAQHRSQAEVGGAVVGACAGDDLEARLDEVGIEVVLDAEAFLDGPVGAIAVEDEVVDVALRQAVGPGRGVAAHRLGLRGTRHAGGLRRDDGHQRHGHQDQTEDVERGGGTGQRAARPCRVDADRDHEREPEQQLHGLGQNLLVEL